jgi:hypothetical protein
MHDEQEPIFCILRRISYLKPKDGLFQKENLEENLRIVLDANNHNSSYRVSNLL